LLILCQSDWFQGKNFRETLDVLDVLNDISIRFGRFGGFFSRASSGFSNANHELSHFSGGVG